MADILAASASTAHVQTAVNAASDGDTVLIPDGTATWTSGITTTKQIIIRAQNITPAEGGTANRNVTLTHNASTSPLFHLTSGDDYYCGVAGIRFNEGTGTGNHVRFSGEGTNQPLLWDVSMQCKQRNGSAADVSVLSWLAIGGVVWNLWLSSDGFDDGVGIGVDGACFYINSPRAWTTASTMGTLDTAGNVNVYVEDSSFLNVGQCPDVDDNGRVVFRHCLFDGAWGTMHGFTSNFGGRAAEYYNNTFSVTYNVDPWRNMAGRYVWCRAGTCLFTDNVANTPANTSEWGNVSQLIVGENVAPEPYPQDRQPGGGHNGSAYVSDPIYLWAQTGGRAYSFGYNGSGWEELVEVGRDVFIDSGAKPGYTKYEYPHPARGDSGDTTLVATTLNATTLTVG